MSTRQLPRKNGNKLAWLAFNGLCTLRNGIGAAGRLALMGQLGEERKRRGKAAARMLAGALK